MSINFNNPVTELTNKVFEQYSNFTTKCAVELIRKIGLEISDNPSKDELIECMAELRSKDYSFKLNRHRGGIQSIELYHHDSLIAGYKFNVLMSEDRLSYKIEATPI